jgi:uncharacterized membrane protein YobD (UPF0266 family)
MKKYQNTNENQIEANLQGIEDCLASLNFTKVTVPAVNFNTYTTPVVSPSLYYTHKKFISLMLSVPALAFAFALVFVNLSNTQNVYLASNDIESLEESNSKILSQINSLDDLGSINTRNTNK